MAKQGEKGTSPREVFERAMRTPDMTPADLAVFRSQKAAVKHQDELRRKALQPDLLDKAA